MCFFFEEDFLEGVMVDFFGCVGGGTECTVIRESLAFGWFLLSTLLSTDCLLLGDNSAQREIVGRPPSRPFYLVLRTRSTRTSLVNS